MEKDDKTCFNAKTNYFDQLTACGAPVCLSKYPTNHLRTSKLAHNFIDHKAGSTPLKSTEEDALAAPQMVTSRRRALIKSHISDFVDLLAYLTFRN